MYLIQLFLPLRDNRNKPFPRAMFVAVRSGLAGALAERFRQKQVLVRALPCEWL